MVLFVKSFFIYDCIEIDSAKKLAIKAIDETLMLKERFVIDDVDLTALLKKSYYHEKIEKR